VLVVAVKRLSDVVLFTTTLPKYRVRLALELRPLPVMSIVAPATPEYCSMPADVYMTIDGAVKTVKVVD